MTARLSGSRALRAALVATGLWPVLRMPLHRLHDGILLFLTRAGLHDPSWFLPPGWDPLALLREVEQRAPAATTATELLPLLDPLVMNASPLAEPSLARMRQFRLPKDVAQHVDGLTARLAAIRALPDLPDLMSDQVRLAAFYRRDGYQLFPELSSRKLVVVFTTMFNNFGVSNAVLYSLLRRHGVSTLLLKDPTVFTFGCGVRGLGDNPEQLASAIMMRAREIGCDEIYAMGFSSGGYASLLFSSLVPCRGYLGFSIRTGSGCEGDPLPRRRAFSDAQDYWVRRKVAPRFQSNLRSVFEQRSDGCQRMLVVGDRDEVDAAHAADVAQCEGFAVQTLANCAHNTVAAALEQGLMDALLTRLLRA